MIFRQVLVYLVLVCQLPATASAGKLRLSPDLKEVIQCDSDTGGKITVLRHHQIQDTHVYVLRQHGETTGVYPGEEDNSRGSLVSVQCLGSKERLLLISGEFTSNYMQGLLFRYQPARKKWERLEFAERERACLLYLKPEQMRLVIPNGGYEAGKYIIVRKFNGKARDTRKLSDGLPKTGGWQVLPVQYPAGLE
ncbi:hypothetical protein ACO0LF_00060 [Undibacterium sp. Di27W]|uniref:hypothetical protein n=1 Tax=Undibacterium sp. Di27W TaxID=3413036 RepID=UPI003BF22AA1